MRQIGLPLDAPRAGNTGALISSAKVDCLEFSLYSLSWERIAGLFLKLDPGEFEHKETGLRGYPFRVQRGHVQILWASEHEKRPVKCLISGQGIDEIGVDAVELIRHVFRHNNGNDNQVKNCISQIHLAIDDFSGKINAELVNDAIMSGKLVTRFRECQRIDGFRFDDGLPVSKGQTWYLGSFKGGRLVRCYDKRQERIAAGEEDPGYWYRFEIQARKQCATELARALVVEGLDGAGGIMRGIIDFRENDNEQADRRTPCDWWMMLCDGLVAVRTGVKKSTATLEKIARWLSHSVSRRLAEVRAILGDTWLNQLLKDGERKTDQGTIATMAREFHVDPCYLGLGKLDVEYSGYCPF